MAACVLDHRNILTLVNFSSPCMNGPRIQSFHFVRGSFLAVKAVFSLNKHSLAETIKTLLMSGYS